MGAPGEGFVKLTLNPTPQILPSRGKGGAGHVTAGTLCVLQTAGPKAAGCPKCPRSWARAKEPHSCVHAC